MIPLQIIGFATGIGLRCWARQATNVGQTCVNQGLGMVQVRIRAVLMMTVAAVSLAACVNQGGPSAGAGSEVATSKSTRLVDRDVEAPEVYQTTDQALWDGRPSLGGVWVASPDTKDPERVIIRNPANGKFVIGALFRREISNPGPKLQISSDTAAALGILAGAPTKINVTALRREEAEVKTDATKPILDTSEAVQTQVLDPVAGAAAAIDRVDAAATPTATAPTATIPKKPAAGATPGARTIQIGIFSVEDNANRAAATVKKAGLAADIRREESQGKVLWSVTSRGDAGTMSKVKGLGFPDAYFLKP